MFSEGDQIVTVARDGARMADRFNSLFITAVYTAVRRKDGVLTWRRAGSAGRSTAGKGVTGPMKARAMAYATERGLPYADGIRHGRAVNPTAPAPAAGSGPDSFNMKPGDVLGGPGGGVMGYNGYSTGD
jgi:hypothetical protein